MSINDLAEVKRPTITMENGFSLAAGYRCFINEAGMEISIVVTVPTNLSETKWWHVATISNLYGLSFDGYRKAIWVDSSNNLRFADASLTIEGGKHIYIYIDKNIMAGKNVTLQTFVGKAVGKLTD